jgi:hypothetical protein
MIPFDSPDLDDAGVLRLLDYQDVFGERRQKGFDRRVALRGWMNLQRSARPQTVESARHAIDLEGEGASLSVGVARNL